MVCDCVYIWENEDNREVGSSCVIIVRHTRVSAELLQRGSIGYNVDSDVA